MSTQLEKVLKKQQQQQKAPVEGEIENVIQLVGFMVGDEEFAVPILSIQEIIKPIEYTRVPKTPEYVLGVFNLRGSVLPLIDLRMKFGLSRSKENEDTRYMVIKHNDEIAGFVIDRLTQATRIKESAIDPAPETIHDDQNLIYGVGKKEDSLISILNVEALLKRDF
ncbi:chemotaxis protein CheW [Hydrogenimonas cancrithermarum]|uniref:Chemotaxis protein CheW n=1 Tax=Hydrogenimonas cancrithermarum TaxID=2993563 RepID=A0ABN6WY20_9BACT|nr:chemotaxis protein CheW [Hydrogenimonas cancrithermarum]BDY13598.1 chemotaxis protein CheW [Hydrogenimonas cancrithermarum]